MKRTILIFALVVALFSLNACKTVQPTIETSRTRDSIVYVTDRVLDSVYFYIDRVEYVKRDTIYINKTEYKERYRYLHDTTKVELLKTDTIRIDETDYETIHELEHSIKMWKQWVFFTLGIGLLIGIAIFASRNSK